MDVDIGGQALTGRFSATASFAFEISSELPSGDPLESTETGPGSSTPCFADGQTEAKAKLRGSIPGPWDHDLSRR